MSHHHAPLVEEPSQGSEGVPLVLLHAFPLDAGMWDDVVELLSERGVPTIAVDAPGFGASPVPAGEPALEQAADALADLLDSLDLDRVVLAGLSMGGYLALAFAQSHAARLAGIALLDTKAGADPEPARRNRLRVAAEADQGRGAAAVAGMLTDLLGATTAEREPDVVARVRQWLAAAPDAGIAWGQRAMAARPDRLEVLAQLPVPGLVLRGEEDGLATPEDAEAMTGALARGGGGELIVVPGAGHLSAVEDPEAVADALAAFWLRCQRS